MTDSDSFDLDALIEAMTPKCPKCGSKSFSTEGVCCVCQDCGCRFVRRMDIFDEGEDAYREAVEVGRELAEEDPDTFLKVVAYNLCNLAGAISVDDERDQEADDTFREALAVYRELSEQEPPACLDEMASCLLRYGDFLMENGNLFDAERAWREMLSIYRTLAEEKPKEYLPEVIRTLNTLGFLLYDMGKMEEAEAAHREALAIQWYLAETDPDEHFPPIAYRLQYLGGFLRKTCRESEGSFLLDLGRHIRDSLKESPPRVVRNNLGGLLDTLVNGLW